MNQAAIVLEVLKDYGTGNQLCYSVMNNVRSYNEKPGEKGPRAAFSAPYLKFDVYEELYPACCLFFHRGSDQFTVSPYPARKFTQSSALEDVDKQLRISQQVVPGKSPKATTTRYNSA